MENKNFARRGKAAVYYGVTSQTITNWADKGSLEVKKAETGERLYLLDPDIKQEVEKYGEYRVKKI